MSATEQVTGLSRLAANFEEFHEDHPEVYEALVAIALELKKNRGQQRGAVAYLVEIARWERLAAIPDDLSIDPAYRAFYARLMAGRESELADFFELRRSLADEWSAAYNGPTSDAYVKRQGA